MKQVVIKLIAPLLCLIGLWSCSDDEPSYSPDNKQWTEKVVAVVLPMEKGLDVPHVAEVGHLQQVVFFLPHVYEMLRGHCHFCLIQVHDILHYSL